MKQPPNAIACYKCSKIWEFQKLDVMIDWAKGHHQYTGHTLEIIRKENNPEGVRTPDGTHEQPLTDTR